MSSLSSTQPAYIDTRRWRRHRVSVPIRVILLRPNKTTIVDGRGHGLSEGGMALTAGLELSVEDQIMVEFTPPYSVSTRFTRFFRPDTNEFWRLEVLLMNHQESEPVEWYIFENVVPESSIVAERALRLGPFTTEDECRSMLYSIQQIPRFSRGTLEVHKRRKRREKRIKAELPVHLRRSATGKVYQLAHTVDISTSGARLAGLTDHMELGEVLEIRCGSQEAPFQVVWAGSPGTAGHGQVGVECLDSGSQHLGIGRVAANG